MLTITKICWGKKFKNEIANYFLPYKSVLLRREHNNYNSNWKNYRDLENAGKVRKKTLQAVLMSMSFNKLPWFEKEYNIYWTEKKNNTSSENCVQQFFKKLKKTSKKHLKTAPPFKKEKKEEKKIFCAGKVFFFVQKKRKKKSKICNSPF